MVLDRVARGEEDHNLLVQIFLQEGEQQQEALVAGAHHVALHEGGDGGLGLLVIDLRKSTPTNF